LHRDVERPLLERAEPRRPRSGSLGRDHQRQPVVDDLGDRRLECTPRLRSVASLDERDARELEHQPEDRDPLGLRLPDPRKAAAKQLHHHDRVDVALVVEHEHARPRRPQMLLPLQHPHVDSGDRQGHLGADRGSDVDRCLARAPE
jgi:hypothetical protein